MIFQPSKYQQAIFDAIDTGDRSLIIIAVAGSGKTTTIVESLKLINKGLSITFIAFNKSIVTELSARIPSHVRAGTFHKIGLNAFARYRGFKYPEIEEKKNRNILRFILSNKFGQEEGRRMFSRLGGQTLNLVAKAKAHGMVPASLKVDSLISLMDDTRKSWCFIADKYDINGFVEYDDFDLAVSYAQEVLTTGITSINTFGIDFDDMLYMPVIVNARFYQSDYVFVDEAQDVSDVQREMLRRMVKPNSGRLVAVGDPHQAIYGFRGADSDSLYNIKADFDAVEYPLSVSYRCPRKVVELAQEYVSHIEPSDQAPEGVYEIVETYSTSDFRPTDAILCRNNANLVTLAYKLIGDGKGCQVLGREIGKGLTSLIERMRAKGVDALQAKLHEYHRRERDKLVEREQEDRAAALDDKMMCLEIFIQNLDENHRTIPELLRRIEDLFADQGDAHEGDAPILTLCSVHKSKGLEWDRVWILDRFELMPSKNARQEWQQRQEINLIYVALTRAKAELRDITLEGCRMGLAA